MNNMDLFGKNSNNTRPAFGIDLGTTNSAISVIREGVIPEIIRLDNNRVTLPSCVTWQGDDNFVVGVESYNQRYRANTIYSVKRLMGSGKNVKLKYNGIEREFTPAEISAEILKELVRQASKNYGEIKDVVITVPAYFNNIQVEATKDAGKLAGLNVISTLREPTSASLVYNMNKEDVSEDKVLVYDLGGGTFDISLVKVNKNLPCPELDELYGFEHKDDNPEDNQGTILSVIKNEGDMLLGGDDIDKELYKIVSNKLKSQGIDVKEFDKESQEKLILKLEGFKKNNKESIQKIEANIKAKTTHGSDISTKIDLLPQDFIDATKVIYDKTKVLVDNVLNGENINNISSIVLVGGSTKSQIVKQMLSKDFPGIRIYDILNPDESVALGAGFQAKRLKFGDKDMQVFDILPLAIGVLADDNVVKVIRKDQVVPYSASKCFATTSVNQSTVKLQVYQGNSSLTEECIYLGDLIIDNIPKNTNGKRSVVLVKLSVNAEGLLTCYATIEGKCREVTLANLFTGEKKEAKVSTVQGKKLLRWRKYAKRLDDTSKDKLNILLDKYEQDESVEKDIISFIANQREEKYLDTEKINVLKKK